MEILGFEKILFHRAKLEKLEKGAPSFPIHATLSLGNFCNHKCLWCTAYVAQKSAARDVDYDRLTSFLSRARERGLKSVGYVGNGEPTAYPRFRDLTRAAHELGLEQGMFTNGYLLDRFMDEVLNGFTYVRISLDAGSAAMHREMHDVEGHFNKIMKNLEALLKRRKGETPTIGVQFAVHHENVDDLFSSVRLCREIGVDYFSVKPVFSRGAVGERIEKNRLTFEDLTPIVADIRRDIESRDFAVYYRPFQILSEEKDKTIFEYDRCVAGFFSIQAHEDGRLMSCGPQQVCIGSMEDVDLIEERIAKEASALDLSKCPSGCRYHALNHLVDAVLNPQRQKRYHGNFL